MAVRRGLEAGDGAQAVAGARIHAGGTDRIGAATWARCAAISTSKRPGEKDGLQWVQATPKDKEGQLHSVKAGFRGDDLAALEILDSFGQRSVITFSRMELNAALAPGQFQFKPPPGADVVRQ